MDRRRTGAILDVGRLPPGLHGRIVLTGNARNPPRWPRGGRHLSWGWSQLHLWGSLGVLLFLVRKIEEPPGGANPGDTKPKPSCPDRTLTVSGTESVYAR